MSNYDIDFIPSKNMEKLRKLGVNISYYKKSNLSVRKSKIHGMGIFTNITIPSNSLVMKPIEKKNTITRYGRLINHCNKPNTKMINIHDEWYLISINTIRKNEEITANYHQAPSFIKRPKSSWTC